MLLIYIFKGFMLKLYKGKNSLIYIILTIVKSYIKVKVKSFV